MMMSETRRLAAALLAALTITLHALPAAAAASDPLDVPLRQYALVLGIAMLGGLVSWLGKVRGGKLYAWQLMHLVGEITTSAFAGLLVFWLCELAEAPRMMTATLVGIAGHMGVRALSEIELWAQRLLQRRPPVA